jgi:hypothetical protein
MVEYTLGVSTDSRFRTQSNAPGVDMLRQMGDRVTRVADDAVFDVALNNRPTDYGMNPQLA